MSANTSVAQISILATHTAFSAWAMANDFLILLVLFAVLFLFAWFVGRGSFVALIIALSAAYAPYSIFPYASFLPAAPPLTAFLTHIGLYAIFGILFFIILRRYIVSDFLYIGLFGLIVLSFLGAGFLIALALNVFLIASIYQFTTTLIALFASKYFFWWFIAPAIGLLFLAR